MKKSIKAITNVITMGIILISIHLFIAKYTEITVYAHTMDDMAITQINEVVQDMKMELDGYVDLYSTEFYETFIDMRTVIGFSATDEGLQLYFNDGAGYYIGVDMMQNNMIRSIDNSYINIEIYNQDIINVLSVTGYEATESGLLLYLNDNSGYWLENVG
ncbi:hypothetical protein D7X88_19535 [bacterium C-53]|nr:hypothetical protein [Lachnospiraceae bacterium]NBI05107.1 hypothetical protein [Lachnospiraceae bacterium]RKJ06738.1 hypothetical protein D7X88_19535 [bacterium C-53]